MAGSLRHIIADNGAFTCDLLDRGGDYVEALYECHQIIAALVDGDFGKLEGVCSALNFPIPRTAPVFCNPPERVYPGAYRVGKPRP